MMKDLVRITIVASFLVINIIGCSGFQQPLAVKTSLATAAARVHHQHQQQQQISRLFVALPSQEEKENDIDIDIDDYDDENECSPFAPSGPATHFGTPIDEATKKRNRELIHSCKSILFDTFFSGKEVTRNFARFYALENIARMPYFSYLSVLHLYETLDRWRQSNYLKVHFSESWNEQHHLLIMESLGGNDRWTDRFLAQHVAVFYYWIVVGLYLVNPTFAYNLNQAVEEEAYETYDNFITKHKEFLESQPAPEVAKEYYMGEDLYLFDAMHHGENNGMNERRRPKMDTLLDTFTAIRDDEMEHVKTMAYLQEDSCQ